MLVGMELVEEFIESVILTGRLKSPHAPLSVLLISTPECGKTSVVSQRKVKSVIAVTDATGRGLLKICEQSPDVSHIVFNDLVAVMSHRQSVNKYTQAMINALTEEGLGTFATPDGVSTIANGRRGIIACLTSELSQDGRAWWNKIGLSSRLLPFFFSHPGTLTLKIKDVIDNGEAKPAKKRGELKIPAHLVKVAIPDKYIKAIRKIADQKATELGDPTGYRRLKQFRALACGHALRRSRNKPTVGDPEIVFLNKIFPYVSYKQPTPL
jgi:hypothetical protein